MKEGQILIDSFISVITDIVISKKYSDDLLGKEKVLGFKKYRRHIKLKDDMKIIFTINNASIIGKNIRPMNTSTWEFRNNQIDINSSIKDCSIWEITNLNSMIRSEKNWRKNNCIKSNLLGCFTLSNLDDDTINYTSIFDFAENVKIVDDKWLYNLV